MLSDDFQRSVLEDDGAVHVFTVKAEIDTSVVAITISLHDNTALVYPIICTNLGIRV